MSDQEIPEDVLNFSLGSSISDYKSSLDEAGQEFRSDINEKLEEEKKGIREDKAKQVAKREQEFQEWRRNVHDSFFTKDVVQEFKDKGLSQRQVVDIATTKEDLRGQLAKFPGGASPAPGSSAWITFLDNAGHWLNPVGGLKGYRMKMKKAYQEHVDNAYLVRFLKMSDEEQREEVRAGGLTRDPGLMDAMLWDQTFTDSFTLGIVKPETTTTRYGSKIKEENPITYGSALLLGEFAGFFATYGAASQARLPKLLTKGGKNTEILMRSLGYIPNKLKSFSNLRGGVNGAFGSVGALEAGYTTAFNMIVNGAIDTVKAQTGKYLRDNELNQAAWEGTLGHTTEGMMRGYGISVVNSPAHMKWRIMGDMALSAGMQIYDQLVGRQDGWDTTRAMSDFVLNMMVGEGVARKFASMTRDVWVKRIAKDNNAKYFDSLIENDSFFKDYTQGQKGLVVEDMIGAVNVATERNPLMVNDAIRSRVYEIAKDREVNGFKYLRMRNDYGHFFDLTKESMDNDFKIPSMEAFQNFKEMGYKVPETEQDAARVLGSLANFTQYLKGNNINITPGGGFIDLPPVNIPDFRRAFSDVASTMMVEGVVPGTPITHNWLNRMYSGVERILANKEQSPFVDTDIAPQDMQSKFLNKPEDFEILSRIASEKGINLTKELYADTVDWFESLDNLSRIDAAAKRARKTLGRRATIDEVRNATQLSLFRDALDEVSTAPRQTSVSANKRGVRKGEEKPEATTFDFEGELHPYGSTKSKKLTDLLIYSSKSKENMMDAIPYFLKIYGGSPSEIRIASAMKEMGIKTSPFQVAKQIERVHSDLKIVRASSDDAIVPIVTKGYDLALTRDMSEDQVKALYNLKRSFLEDSDDRVAVPKRIPFTHRDEIDKNGAFIIDLEDTARTMESTSGKITRERVIQGIKTIVKENALSYNKRQGPNKVGRVSRIHVTSPSETKMVIYGENARIGDVEAFSKDMFNLVKGTYQGDFDNYRRSFVFKVPSIMEATHVNGFKDIRLARVGKYDDIKSYSAIRQAILDKLVQNAPDSWVLKNDSSFYMDMEEESLMKAAASKNIDEFFNYLNEGKSFKDFPEIMPPIANHNERIKQAELMGSTPDEIRASTTPEERELYSQNIYSSPEWRSHEVYKAATLKGVTLPEIIMSYEVAPKTKDELDNSIFSKVYSQEAEADEALAKSKGFFGRAIDEAKTFFGDIVKPRDPRSSVGQVMQQRLDVRTRDQKKELTTIISQGTFTDKHALPNDVHSYMGRMAADILQRFFPPKRDPQTLKPLPNGLPNRVRERRLKGFMDVYSWVDEFETSRLLEPDGRIKAGIKQKLQEPINWSDSKKTLWDWDGMLDTADKSFNNFEMRRYQLETADELAFSKLLIEKFNLNIDDYLTWVVRSKKMVHDVLQPLWMEAGIRQGMYLNLNDMSGMKDAVANNLFEMVRTLRPSFIEKHGPDIMPGSTLYNEVVNAIKNGTFLPKNPDIAKNLGIRLQHLKETDFGNLSYVYHSVLDDPANKKAWQRIIATYAGDRKIKLSDPREPEPGRLLTDEQIPDMKPDTDERIKEVLGDDASRISDPDMKIAIDAMTGRSHPTLAQLTDLDFRVGTNWFNNMAGQLRYLFSKTYTMNVGRSMKERTMRGYLENYEDISLVRRQMEKLAVEKRSVISPIDKVEQFIKLIGIEREARSNLLKWVGMNGGYVYMPSPLEAASLREQIKDLEKIYNELPDLPGDNTHKTTLKKNIDSLTKTKDDIDGLIKIFDGSDTIEPYDRLVQWIGKIKAGEQAKKKAKQKYDHVFLERYSTERINAIKAMGDTAVKKFEEELVYRIYGTTDPRDIKGNPLMPVDLKSHEYSSHYLHEKDPKTGQYKRPLMQKAIKTDFRGKNILGLSYDLQASPNAPGFEGIYMQRSSLETFRQFLYRNSMTPEFEGSGVIDTGIRMYDKSGSWLKRIRLWQPQIMFWNDMAQSFILGSVHNVVKDMIVDAPVGVYNKASATINKALGGHYLKEVSTNIQTAGRILKLKEKKGSLEAYTYDMFDKANLFNKSVGTPEMINDANQTAVDFLLRNDKLKIVQKLQSLNVKSGLTDEAAEALANKQYIKLSGKLLQMAGTGPGMAVRTMQEGTWLVDEYIRLSTAIPWQKKLHKYYRDTYKKSGMENWEAQAETDSYRRASDIVNDAMIEYSRRPLSTRKVLNRGLMYSVYRLGTAGLYGKVITDFGRGMARSFGFNPDQKFMISDHRFRQAAFEMAPMVRWWAGALAIQAIALATFGGSYESFGHLLHEYRVRRDENTEEFGYRRGVLSFATPLFDMKKFLTRDAELTLKFNLAAWPQIIWALSENAHPVTGRALYTADPEEEPMLARAQLGLSLLEWHTPFMPDWRSWSEEDKSLGLRVIETFGLGYYYNTDDVGEMVRDYKAALSRANTVEKRREAYNRFNRRLKQRRRQWSDRKFKKRMFELKSGREVFRGE